MKSENSRLRMQTDAQENKIQEKDNEVLRLLNQIATDMIRKSDVDRLIEEAVAKAVASVKADYEERMKSMAAEYEAKIAEIQNQNDKGKDDKDQNPGKSTKNSKKKGGTVICNSMEEAMQRIQEEMNKATVMQDMAFGGGGEKLSSEQKPAVNPEEGNADDDSKVQSPISPRGDYGERDNESKPRAEEYSNYIKVDKEDEIVVDCYPEGCDKNTKTCGKRTNVIWELSLPKLKKMLVNLYRCKVNGKKVWAKMPNKDSLLKGSHVGTMYAVNLILNKYLNGTAENRTRKSIEYITGADIPKQTNNTMVNKLLTKIRNKFEETYRRHILIDPYLATDETVGDVFVDDNGEVHLRTRYFWGFRTSVTNLVYFIYDKGSRSREVIIKFLKEFFGTIQTDGASMYKIFEKDPTLHVTRLSCLVHIRRYFLKSMKFEDKTGVAYKFLERIRLIYEYEKSYKKLSDKERKDRRDFDIVPILTDMYQDLLYYANNTAVKCGELLMKAINYALAEWKGLIRYTEDGMYRVDNNYAEQCMRDLACGRKNFLFCGSDNAAKNLAFAYSLTESCKLNNINPYEYWADLIDFIGCEGIDLNSFVHSQWHKHTNVA
ncbi:MAG: IS66 family transposase [Butyrivibrio sp.]|nr:IS66 family transposase [Butyrivibrio sp.]